MKVLIIDDHILFAEGMRFLLSSFKKDINTLYAEDFEAAVDVISEKGIPDLIILDINLVGVNGFTLIKKFHNLNIWSPILVVSATDSPATAMVALQKGASGFIAKASDSKTLLDAIQVVLKGDTYPPQQKSNSRKLNSDEGKVEITNRQHEILYLLSQGLLNKQIAYELHISSNTVKAHLHHIFKELNVHNRTAAVQNAQRYGLI
jgi:DNA-binding NarL/FixJ family response regulator